MAAEKGRAVSGSIAGWLSDLLWPRKCVICRRILDREPGMLCTACRQSLPPPEQGPKRGAYYKACICACSYDGDLRQAVLRFKFGGRSCYAETFGQLLAGAVRAQPKVKFDCITYVSLGRKRRRKRGYDQAELLAEALGRELGVPVIRTVRKLRDTPPQSRVSGASARRINIRNAYAPVEIPAWAGKRLLLVDDILTTGATLSEVSRVLLQAGAASVSCAVLAKTPRRHGSK